MNLNGKSITSLMEQVLASEFPFVEALPKREKSRLRKAWDVFNDLRVLTEQHGTLVPASLVAKILDLSPQRVHDIIQDGRLHRIEVHGHNYISEASVIEFAKTERKAGRPQKMENATAKDCLKVAVEWAKETKQKK